MYRPCYVSQMLSMIFSSPTAAKKRKRGTLGIVNRLSNLIQHRLLSCVTGRRRMYLAVLGGTITLTEGALALPKRPETC